MFDLVVVLCGFVVCFGQNYGVTLLSNTKKEPGDIWNSKLIIQEAFAEPDSHGWSICEQCSVNGLDLFYFNLFNTTDVDLSWSLWGEFFHKFNNDQFVGVRDLNNIKSYQTSTGVPVYVLPMITFHIGHLLVDFLEQVYFNMLDTYGQVRKDAIIVIDVGGMEERLILQSKLDLNSFNCTTQSFGCTVRNALTSSRFLSSESLLSMTQHLVGEEKIEKGAVSGGVGNIHVGLDNSRSFHQMGYALHPRVFNTAIGNNDIAEMSQYYQQFSEYFTSFTDQLVNRSDVNTRNKINRTETVLNVLFVTRLSDRIITNLQEILACSALSEVQVSVVALEDLSFEQQLLELHSADILVATAGTSLHNMIFMRHRITAVIIVMQAHWCPWAWMYANQAVLLGIRSFIYCASSSSDDVASSGVQPPLKYFQWSRHFWRQGPKPTKSANVTVDVVRFELLFNSARSYLRNNNQALPVEPEETFNKYAELGSDGHSQRMFLSGETATSVRSRRPSIELYVSSFSVTPTQTAPDGSGASTAWRIGISGEIGLQGEGGSRRAGLTSMQHLSICLQVLPVASPELEALSVPTWCYPIHSLNYYSELLVNVGDPLHLLHFWVQISSRGGKVRNSNVFHILDCRLPDGGHSVLNGLGEPTEYSVFVHKNCPNAFHIGRVSLANHASGNQCVVSNKYGFRLERAGAHSFQRQTTDFCMSNGPFSINDCGAFIVAVSKQLWFEHLLAEEEGLPAVQRMPSPTSPFVFLHIEKTGGTTMREFIIESAEALSLKSFVPCHGGVHCVTLELPPADSLGNVSIVAGHFFWDVWKALPACRPGRFEDGLLSNAEQNAHDRSCQPSPLVIGRHPVERAISYYYQRCYQLSTCTGYQRRINELSVADLEFIAIHERQAAFAENNSTLVILDEGMSNAACRSLAGAKATSGLHFSADSGIRLPPPLTDDERLRAMTHIQQCVVGILERWESTLVVVGEWFPWLNLLTDRTRRKMFLYSGKESKDDIRPELRELLERLNDCDMILYSEMERLFDLQLSKLAEKNHYYQ